MLQPLLSFLRRPWKRPLRFDEVDVAQLSECRPGDRLKLWTSPNYDRINAYRPGTVGGEGKVGGLSKAQSPRIAAALAEGLPAWLEVVSIDGTKVHLEAKFMTREEVAAEEASAAGKLKAELLKPLRKHEPMSIELRAPEGFEFKVGQSYSIDVPPLEEYVRNPPFDVGLVAPDGAKARAIPPAAQRRLLLRAHFGGLTVHIHVAEVAQEPAWASDQDGVWKEAAATARVVMLKPGNAPA